LIITLLSDHLDAADEEELQAQHSASS
jgi:hypothetical protein